jgi:hypothetical protein
LVAPDADLYDDAMADDNHHSLRVPARLWKQGYAALVGNNGRSTDLKMFIDWQARNPDAHLGEDIGEPYDFLATIRVEDELWEAFATAVGEKNCSSRLRAYIWWRVQNPDAALPGSETAPRRSLACV